MANMARARQCCQPSAGRSGEARAACGPKDHHTAQRAGAAMHHHRRHPDGRSVARSQRSWAMVGSAVVSQLDVTCRVREATCVALWERLAGSG